MALEEVLDIQAYQGWEFMRSETLAIEVRKGLFGKAVQTQAVLVFRRPVGDGETALSLGDPLIKAPMPVPEPQGAPRGISPLSPEQGPNTPPLSTPQPGAMMRRPQPWLKD